MKSIKLFFTALSILFFAGQSTAQETSSIAPQACKLEIKGPREICCKQGIYTFTTSLPAGCQYSWSVSPNVPFTGQGTGTIHLNAQQLPCDSKLIITVKVKCKPTHECPSGYYIGTYTVYIRPAVNASFNMNLNVTTTGISVNATSAVPNCQNHWVLFEANCSTQALIAFVNSSNTPNYSYSPLKTGKCYVLYHYVNCGGCWAWKRRFFTVTNAKAVMAAGQGEDEKPLPKEFSKYLPQGVEQN
jgi:hypothetical protein